MKSYAIWAATLAAMALVSTRAADSNDAPSVLAGPWLADLSADSACVVWLADRDSTGAIEWSDATGGLRRAVASTDGLVDAPRRSHRIGVDGLTPGSTTRLRTITRTLLKLEPYAATLGGAITNVVDVRVPRAIRERVSFAVVNDLHSNEPVVRQVLARAIAVGLPDGVFLNGDIFNDPRSEAQVVTPVLAPVTEALGTRTPAWFVRGNHETRGSLARSLGDYILPRGAGWSRAFTVGPVRVILMDSGEDKDDANKAYSGLADFDANRTAQARWLTDEAGGRPWREAAFRIVLSHIPPFSTDDAQGWHGPQDVSAKWAPAVRGKGLTAWISGHTHAAEVVDPAPGKHDYPVFIGGAPKAGEATVMRIEADRSRMTVVLARADGTEIARRDFAASKPPAIAP